MKSFNFKTTAEIKVSNTIVEQIIGQDNAVNIVKKWYEKRGWRIVIQKGKPYDLVANKGTNRRYIEVKGSMNQPSNFKALLTENENKFIKKCLDNKMHYRFHIVAGFGRHKKIIHRYFTAQKLPRPKPAGHYYITLKLK